MSDSVPVRHWVVIPAAGSGSRMGAEVPKQYLALGDETVLAQTLRRFVSHPAVTGMVVVLAPGDPYWSAIDPSLRAAVETVDGGAERADSVRRGMAALTGRAADGDWVLVHDAARPCLRRDDLDRLLTTLADDPVGGILAVPTGDTLKRAAAGIITATVPRTDLWHAQTPQMFRFGVLRAALADAGEVTDEALAVERAGHAVHLVEGHADNLKITRPEDLALAAWYLAKAEKEAQCVSVTV